MTQSPADQITAYINEHVDFYWLINIRDFISIKTIREARANSIYFCQQVLVMINKIFAPHTAYIKKTSVNLSSVGISRTLKIIDLTGTSKI